MVLSLITWYQIFTCIIIIINKNSCSVFVRAFAYATSPMREELYRVLKEGSISLEGCKKGNGIVHPFF